MIHFLLKMRYVFRAIAFVGLVVLLITGYYYLGDNVRNPLDKSTTSPTVDDVTRSALANSLSDEEIDRMLANLNADDPNGISAQQSGRSDDAGSKPQQ